MDRQITEQIVDNALLNDKEGFMSAFQAAMATKVADALEVKKVEVASNMLGAAEVAAQEDTLEEEVEQIDEAGLVSSLVSAYFRPKAVAAASRLTTKVARKFGASPQTQRRLAQGASNWASSKFAAEEVEQIDEISKDLVDKYRNKAWNWVSKATNAPARYSDGRKTVAAQQAYLHKAAQKITKAAKRLKSMELADKKFSARSNATHVVPATSKYTKEEVEQIDEAIDHKKLAIQGLMHHTLANDPSMFSSKEVDFYGSRTGKKLRGIVVTHSTNPTTKQRTVHIMDSGGKFHVFEVPTVNEGVEQVDEARAKMTDAHKKIARQVHRDLKSDESVGQAYGFRVRQMHTLLRKKYGSNWRALAGIKEEVEQIDEGKNPYQLFADHPKFQEAHDAIDSAVKAGDVHAVVKAMSRYSHVGAQDSQSRDEIFPRLKRRNKNVWYDYDEKNWHKRPKKEISEEAEQIDEMEKDVSGPGRDGDGAHFTGSKDKKPVIKMTGKERKTSDALARALKRLAAKKLPK